MTASQVLCLSCIWMELNLRWMMLTIRSISLGEMGRVRLCSRSRFMTWVVNSLHAWDNRRKRRRNPQDQSSHSGRQGHATPTLRLLGTFPQAVNQRRPHKLLLTTMETRAFWNCLCGL